MATDDFNDQRDRLNAELHEERRKRVRLCELFLLTIGVEPGGVEPGNSFLDNLVRTTAQDLDVLCAALAQSSAEDPRTPGVVSRLADRLRYGQLASGQVAELLPEMQLAGSTGRGEEP